MASPRPLLRYTTTAPAGAAWATHRARSPRAPVSSPLTRMSASALEPASAILDHVAQDRVERDLRAISDETLDLGQVGDPRPDVLEARAVGLLVRHADDLRGATGQRLDPAGELEDRHRLDTADVHDLALGPRLVHERPQRAHCVPNVRE